MARILVRRSDGILQHYNIKPRIAIQMISALEKVKYKGRTRMRRVYASPSVMPLRKERAYPTITESHEFKEKKRLTTDRPISGEAGQVHVRLRAIKNGQMQYSDGYSHILDLERQYERGKQQAVDHALSMMGFSGINDFYGEGESGSPDEIKVIKIDFIYLIPK